MNAHKHTLIAESDRAFARTGHVSMVVARARVTTTCGHCRIESAVYELFPLCESCGERTCAKCAVDGSVDATKRGVSCLCVLCADEIGGAA